LPVPPVLGGSIEKVWFSLGMEFAKHGHQVTHISCEFPGFPCDEWLHGVHHLRVKGLEFSSSRYRLVWRDLWYSLRVLRVLPRADVLVTNTPLLPLLIRTRRFGALYVHAARYPKWQMRFYRHASRIQAVSRAVADAIRRRNPGNAGKVRAIPNPLPSAVPTLDPAASWRERANEILYVGRLHPEKGVHLLVDAFRRLVESGVPDWRLAIVGPWAAAQGGGGDNYYESLRARSLAVADRVSFVGPVFDPDALAAHYRRAKLFVYPSLAEFGESFGLAPLEAMAQGCPPLVSALACFREFVEDGISGFIFEHRSERAAEELYGALRRILSAEPELISVAVRSHEVARGFDLARVARMYLEDFAAIVGHPGASHDPTPGTHILAGEKRE